MKGREASTPQPTFTSDVYRKNRPRRPHLSLGPENAKIGFFVSHRESLPAPEIYIYLSIYINTSHHLRAQASTGSTQHEGRGYAVGYRSFTCLSKVGSWIGQTRNQFAGEFWADDESVSLEVEVPDCLFLDE